MTHANVSLDLSLDVRVSRYADGVGVSLEELVERAVVYAISSLYPDQDLPDRPERPDNSLPGQPPEASQLPAPFDPKVDNELPEGEVPTDPGYGLEENPNPNLNPDLDPDVDASNRPDQELPENPEPKS